jgi:molybdenum-dependent DNA-binding transcriptional regulator ModE
VQDRRGRGISAATLSAEEREMLRLYRRLARPARATVLDIAESLAAADQARR